MYETSTRQVYLKHLGSLEKDKWRKLIICAKNLIASETDEVNKYVIFSREDKLSSFSQVTNSVMRKEKQLLGE